MGKRRKSGKSKNNINKSRDEYEDTTIDPTSRSFVHDEVDDFHDAYEDHLLSQVTFKKPKVPEREQVLGLGDSSSDSDKEDEDESDEDNLYMEDDIVEKKEKKLPDERAWGKKKYLYFHTDTTDERLNRVVKSGKSEAFSNLEGEAARKFQQRLDEQIQDLQDDDLLVQATSVKDKKRTDDVAFKVGKDISHLSEKQKKRLLKQQSPEFYLIVKDFEEKSKEFNDLIKPLMEARQANKIQHRNLDNYITTRYQLLSYYVTNTLAYFMLRCESSNLSHHPVITKLTQYRTLLKKLDPIHQNLLPKLEEYCTAWKAGKDLNIPKDPNFTQDKITNKKKPRKLLQLLKSNAIEMSSDDNDDSDSDISVSSEEEMKVADNSQMVIDQDSDDGEKEPIKMPSDQSDSEEEKDENERRAITYEMSKNKGLIPSRRKDQQNPRVKYRMKYTKKLKLRQGQVRKVRNEEKRYTGEKSGINVRAVKSVKLK